MTPFFLEHQNYSLFVNYYPSNTEKCVLCIPAFAEEMNKSRRMVSQQARAWVEQGYSVVSFDLFGTGDSYGEFGEATWRIWLDNINELILWLKTKGYSQISLWSLRAGSLLALDFLNRTDEKFDRLIAWQPVLTGEQYVMQFLRLKAAASFMENNAPQIKTSEIKQRLIEGHTEEVAGYLLNPQLMVPMLELKCLQNDINNVGYFHVFEISLDEASTPTYQTQKWVDNLKQLNNHVSLEILNDIQFWASQEITESKKLISLTCQALDE